MRALAAAIAATIGIGCTSPPPIPAAFERSGQSGDLLCQLAEGPSIRVTGASGPACGCGTELRSDCAVIGTLDDRRRSILVATGKTWTQGVTTHGADRLRFSVLGFPRGARFDLEASVGEEAPQAVAIEPFGPWQEIDLTLPAGTDHTTLRLVVRPRIATDGTTAIALGEPRLVRATEASRPTNVIVYMIDTLRADHTSAYGYERPTTPRLEEFAKRSILFENAFSTAARTRPSVGSLLSGVYPTYHGTRWHRGLAWETTTLAEIFRGAGWSTWAFAVNGHIHDPSLNFQQGFDVFRAIPGKRRNNHARASEVNDILFPLLSNRRDEPFFAYVHTIDPHSPYDPPEETAGRFSAPDYDGVVNPDNAKGRALRRLSLSPADRAKVVDLYDEDILYQDQMFGALLDHLEEIGIADRTIVAVVSDHGEEFYEHEDWEHGRRLYEHQLRVPFLLHVPGQYAATTVHQPVSGIDLMPTLLSWVGLAVPADIQGRDLRPLIAGRAPAPVPVYAQEDGWNNTEIASLSDGNWKIIRWRGDKTEYALFDLQADPGEQNDLAEQTNAQSELQRMIAALDAREATLDATTPHRQGPPQKLRGRTHEQLRALGYIN